MKTAKSIIVVLSVLLTAQVALAFYCPATGRWLSRDPIGEPGFQLLQQVSQTTHAPAVMPSSSRWIHRDSADGNSYAFVHNNSISYVDPVGLFDWEGHYFFGHGDPVDLGDINLGHLFEAEPSVVGAVNEFNDMLFTVAKHKASKLCVKVGGNPSINFPWSNKTVTDVTSNPGLFPVGHSTFFEKAKCRLTVDCCKKTFKVQCNNRYAIRDWFADPLDGGFEIPGGTPYRINYSFTRFFSSGGGF